MDESKYDVRVWTGSFSRPDHNFLLRGDLTLSEAKKYVKDLALLSRILEDDFSLDNIYIDGVSSRNDILYIYEVCRHRRMCPIQNDESQCETPLLIGPIPRRVLSYYISKEYISKEYISKEYISKEYISKEESPMGRLPFYPGDESLLYLRSPSFCMERVFECETDISGYNSEILFISSESRMYHFAQRNLERVKRANIDSKLKNFTMMLIETQGYIFPGVDEWFQALDVLRFTFAKHALKLLLRRGLLKT